MIYYCNNILIKNKNKFYVKVFKADLMPDNIPEHTSTSAWCVHHSLKISSQKEPINRHSAKIQSGKWVKLKWWKFQMMSFGSFELSLQNIYLI